MTSIDCNRAGVWRPPLRPAGAVTLGYGVKVRWATAPHNGIDLESNLWTPIRAVGSGKLDAFTKPNAGRFGSINPDGAGPAIWQQITTSCGEPIYILYGHTADSWRDNTRLQPFVFSVSYRVKSPGVNVPYGGTIGLTAPFYNGTKSMPHLHLSVFKPTRLSNGSYSRPPSSGWGYSALTTTAGKYVNPEEFFHSYRVH